MAELVVSDRCSFGVVGTYPMIPPALASERLIAVGMATVAAPGHPLAGLAGPVPLHRAEAETQRTACRSG